MTLRLAPFVHVCIGAVVLASVFFWNGRPSLFTDTKAYFVLGEQIAEKAHLVPGGASELDLVGQKDNANRPASDIDAKERIDRALTVAGTRSPYYGVYLFLLSHYGTFWLVIAVQALLVSFIIWTGLTLSLERNFQAAFYQAIGLVGVFSTAPIYVAYMMPDIFTGLGILAFSYLFVFGSQIESKRVVALFAILAFAGLAHSTHVAILAGLFLTGLILTWCEPIFRSLSRTAGVAIVAAVLISCLGSPIYALVARAVLHQEIRRAPFLMARVLEDGPGRKYLQAACSVDPSRYELCRFRNAPLDSVQTFLWDKESGHGVFASADAGTRVKLIDEERSFVAGTLRFDPLGQFAASMRNFLFQLVRVRVDDATDASAVTSNPDYQLFRRLMPFSDICWKEPNRCRSRLPDALVGWILEIVFLTSMLFSFLMVRASWGEPTARKKAIALLILATTALLVNAAVCGIISGPFPRYMTRVTWIFPLIAVMIFNMRRRVRSRNDQRQVDNMQSYHPVA